MAKKAKPKPRTRWIIEPRPGVLLFVCDPSKKKALARAERLGFGGRVVKFVEVCDET